MTQSPLDRVRLYHQELTAIRRDIHAHPELGMEEHRTADLVARKLGNTAACATHRVPLPGGEAPAAPADVLAREHSVPPFAVARIAYRHGAEAERVLAIAEADPDLRGLACSCEGVALAELAFSLREEFAESLTDLRRRCRLGMGVCQGARCAGTAAALRSCATFRA